MKLLWVFTFSYIILISYFKCREGRFASSSRKLKISNAFTHPLWLFLPLAGWVICHRMLIADQNRIIEALSAFAAQVEAGFTLIPQQRTAFRTFYDRYIQMFHHHHDNEENNIEFPYFKGNHMPSTKLHADHKIILEIVEKCNRLTAALGTMEKSREAKAIRKLLVRLKASNKSILLLKLLFITLIVRCPVLFFEFKLLHIKSPLFFYMACRSVLGDSPLLPLCYLCGEDKL